MDVKYIDVVRAQLLERRLNGDVHRLDIVPRVVHLLLNFLGIFLEDCRVLFAPPRKI